VLLDLQAARQKVDCLIGNIDLGRNLNLRRPHDCFIEFRHAPGTPRMSSNQQFIEDDADTPNIALGTVRLLRQDLGRHVERSSNDSPSQLAGR
jgi:hypothetical protein